MQIDSYHMRWIRSSLKSGHEVRPTRKIDHPPNSRFSGLDFSEQNGTPQGLSEPWPPLQRAAHRADTAAIQQLLEEQSKKKGGAHGVMGKWSPLVLCFFFPYVFFLSMSIILSDLSLSFVRALHVASTIASWPGALNPFLFGPREHSAGTGK